MFDSVGKAELDGGVEIEREKDSILHSKKSDGTKEQRQRGFSLESTTIEIIENNFISPLI